MAEESDQEKTEDPTGRRLDEARGKGQIPRSHELVGFAILAAGLSTLFSISGTIYDAIKRITIANLRFDRASLGQLDQMTAQLQNSSSEMLIAILPLLGACAVAAIAANLAVSGWLFTWEPLTPDFGRLNPLTGLGRLFSVKALIEGGKALLKSLLIGGVAVLTLWSERDEVLQLIVMSPFESMAYVWELVRFTLMMVVGSMIIIVAIDVPFQLWDYKRNLRMTKQEVKQESKESEGSPEIKMKIRQLQMQAARKRMMAEIPKANVIVTNPTHYAVALRYDEKKMKAPKVVAKGSFLLAERIIDLGKEHKVPILRTPPLARALYHHAELDQDIPSALYTAVAEVLAYLYQMKQWKQFGGIQPDQPRKLQVPAELDPGGEA